MESLAEKIRRQRIERAERQKTMAQRYGKRIPALIAEGYDGDCVALMAKRAAFHGFAHLNTLSLLR